MPGVMNGYRQAEYDPYARRDPRGDPFRRPNEPAYDPYARRGEEPQYSTSIPRNQREDPYARNGYGPPPRDNGYGPRDNGQGPYDRKPDQRRGSDLDSIGGRPGSFRADYGAERDSRDSHRHARQDSENSNFRANQDDRNAPAYSGAYGSNPEKGYPPSRDGLDGYLDDRDRDFRNSWKDDGFGATRDRREDGYPPKGSATGSEGHPYMMALKNKLRGDDSGREQFQQVPTADSAYDPARSNSLSDRRDSERSYDDYGKMKTKQEYDSRSEPTMYELDHLATFTVGQGLVTPEDGIRKLRQMEASTGIWTMRAQLIVQPDEILIIDKQSMEEIENFPMSSVTQPMAVTNPSRRDVYNNIVLFTVQEDRRKGSPTEMHIFQCIAKPAQDIVDDIVAAKEGRNRNARYVPPPQRDPRDRERDRERDRHAVEYAAAAASAYPQQGPKPSRELQKSIRRRDADTESVLSERTDRDVVPVDDLQQLLNHCFDDIERFVGRLQQVAESYKEMERRRRDKKQHDGMLSYRARLPPAEDFIDCFQKFKLSFNLLAKVKPHIHRPNAPELVHLLFTPLGLVVKAVKDSAPELPSRVISPLLTADAVDLLRNCLSSEETDLWFSLGDAWNIPKEKWKDYVPAYFPRFTDGWQPSSGAIEEMEMDARPPPRDDRDHYRDPPGRYEDRDRYDRRDDPARGRYEDDPSRNRPPPREDPRDYRQSGYNDRPPPSSSGRDDYREEASRPRDPPPAGRPPPSSANMSWDDLQADFRARLVRQNNKVFEVTADRTGRNSKELSVKKGEILEVLDDSRNWYKLRNYKGDVGHAPYTIIQPVRK